MPGQYTDKALKCVDCQAEFVFSAGEQERFAELGFQNEPKRCQPCRAAKKMARGEDGNDARGGGTRIQGPREYHKAKCASCGQEAVVPFKPRGDKPVYCSNCFSQQKK